MNDTLDKVTRIGKKLLVKNTNKQSEQIEDIFTVCSDQIFSNRHFNYYEVNVLNSSTIEVQCYLNYHRLSGHYYRHCLPDGRWTGEELQCEVDYYKERYRLSLFIILVTAVLAITVLGFDFCRHLKKRLKIRRQRKRLGMCRLKKTFQDGILKGHPLYKFSLNQEHHLHLTQSFPQGYENKKMSHALTGKDSSNMGAFGFRSHPQVSKGDSATILSKGKKFEKGMYLFRMRNSGFFHPDIEHRGGSP